MSPDLLKTQIIQLQTDLKTKKQRNAVLQDILERERTLRRLEIGEWEEKVRIEEKRREEVEMKERECGRRCRELEWVVRKGRERLRGVLRERDGVLERLGKRGDGLEGDVWSGVGCVDEGRGDDRRRIEELEMQVERLRDERDRLAAEKDSTEKKTGEQKIEDINGAPHLALKAELRRQRTRRQELEREQEDTLVQMTKLQQELKSLQEDFHKVKSQDCNEALQEALGIEKGKHKEDRERLRGARSYTIKLEDELVREKMKVDELSIELIKTHLRDPDDPVRFGKKQNEWRAAREQEIQGLRGQIEGLEQNGEGYESLEKGITETYESRYLREQWDNNRGRLELEDEVRVLRVENARLLKRQQEIKKENKSLKLRLQEEVFKREEVSKREEVRPWPQPSLADSGLELKRLQTMIHQWARANTRALDIRWTDEERTELIQALKAVMKIEDGTSEITMKNHCGVYGSRSLLLEALLNHHIFTSIFKNPFFFLSEGNTKELKDLYEVAKSSDEKATSTWRADTLRILRPERKPHDPKPAPRIHDITQALIVTAAERNAAHFLAGPTRYLLSRVSSEDMKKIVLIYKGMAELAYMAWSARMDVRVLGIEELDGEPRAGVVERFGLLRQVSGGDEHLEYAGRTIQLATRPMVEFYRYERGGDENRKSAGARVVQKAGVYWDDVGCEAQTILFDPASKMEVVPEWI
ncbi:hypothetical protein ACMFMG_002376 [Clarireedia jacksonii]